MALLKLFSLQTPPFLANPVRPPQPEEEITYSCQEDDIRAKMKDPNAEILHCEICEIPVGDEKMLGLHYETKAHRHKANVAFRDDQAKNPLIGNWYHRVSHRQYWYATGYWQPATSNYFGPYEDLQIPKYYAGNFIS